MLDTTHNPAALLPQQVAAHASDPRATACGSRLPWCVVTSQPRAERTAHAELHRRGFEAYLPLCTWRRPNRHWSTGPLFPRYLFVRMDPNASWNPVLYAPGVYSLLFSGEKPGTVAEAVLDALRAGEEARGIPTTQDTLYRPGAPCEAVLGGGSRVEAVVMAVNGQKVRVSAIMFGQMREMTVEISNLRLRGE
jgi:transcription antitermination factor NusG